MEIKVYRGVKPEGERVSLEGTEAVYEDMHCPLNPDYSSIETVLVMAEAMLDLKGITVRDGDILTADGTPYFKDGLTYKRMEKEV